MKLLSARVVVFDKDGTLIDFHATWGPAVVKVLADLSRGDAVRLSTAAERLRIDLRTGTIQPDSPVVAQSTGELALLVASDLGRDDVDTLAAEIDCLGRHHTCDSLVVDPEPVEGAQPHTGGACAIGAS